MKRLSALSLQEKLRSKDTSVLCVTRRRAPSVDEVVRRLDAAGKALDVDIYALDGDDGETAALLPDLGVTMIPCVIVVAGGSVVERVGTIRDTVDARRLVALAAATRATRPPGAATHATVPPDTSLPPADARPSSVPTTAPARRS
jgi:hypothetical protein